MSSQTEEPAAGNWRSGFEERSATTFSAGFADDVVLEASTLVQPIVGRERVARTLEAASGIYESLEFTASEQDGLTTYLQWRATAFGGVEIKGVTVLEHDFDGKVVAAAIHHRPLDVALRFSAEIRDRLTGVVPRDHFFSGTVG
ncbi:nuclear transport factor 2 family protein [Streptosporangium sp. NPDC048865]|uniref:nuclear transport factor 2 family protein n=1 Tax=Streptosporangium sp. NPDC048865 TaxID=3155766 RepID=UPI003440C415